MVEWNHEELSIRHQCELLGLNRATLYCRGVGESKENLELMRLVDEQYQRTPFFGSRSMTTWLCRQGNNVNRKRIQRLMRLMGLEAIYPKPRTSQRGDNHRIYPYLLRNVKIVRPNQVWSTDITYIPMARGFTYLVAILDWYSRFVLSWRLSNSLEGSFCVEALEEALSWQRPEIFNSDQGVQFTSSAFTSVLEDVGVAISMDGRGRVFDNIFVERLWRTVKYEDIYLKDYGNMPALRRGLGEYLDFYCYARFHQSLENRTPWDVYTEALSRKEQRQREKNQQVADVKRRAYSHI